MILKELHLRNFKNIGEADLEFSPKLNCLLGNNGMGKSNLLDSLYLLSYCRSFTGLSDAALIRHGENFSTVRGVYSRRGLDEELTAGIAPGRRKSFRRNGKEYRRLAEHLGVFPLVMVSGGDTTVTSGEPSERRRFVDQTASQSRAGYLDALMRYNSAVEQRNGLLRAENRAADSLFEAIEFQIEMSASELVRERRVTVEALSELVRDIYGRLSGDVESAGLAYRPSFDTEAASLAQKLGATRARDLILGHTSSGPHRDELDFTIGGIPLRRYASQGQEKSFAIALRLAQYRLLHGSLGIHPLLLLDDVFDRLDAGRVEALIGIVSGDECYGQIFVTDTDRHHLGEIIGRHPSASRMWRVENGSFIES